MYIAVCDDLAQARESVAVALERWSRERGVALHYHVFSSASEMLDSVGTDPFSLYLLDIMMPGVDGLTAAREIRAADETAEIVFLTTSPGFAYDSYGVRAMDYLLKPVEEERLFALLDTLWRREQRPSEGLTIKSGNTIHRVLFSQLSYVEVSGKHLYFHMADGTVQECFGTLREYETALLRREEFIHTHRSYIVNMFHIAELSPLGIITFSGESVPVSRLLYGQVQEQYMKLLFAEREE